MKFSLTFGSGAFMLNSASKKISFMGITAGLYIVLSVAVLPLASGAVQVRLAECLTILSLFFPEAIVGVFVGCALVNLITGCALFDIIFGSLVTLVSGLLTYYFGKKIKKTGLKFIVGGLFPVLLNSFLLPLIWFFAYGMIEYIYILQVAFLLIGESIAVYGVGFIIYKVIKKFLNK